MEPQPRPIVSGSNPRPWEWRSWNQEDHEEKGAPDKPMSGPGGPAKGGVDPESAAVQHIIEQLPAEERSVFMRNFKRWAQMTTGERQTLRQQALERRERMEQEMDGALRESGLRLDSDQREVFMLRYGQERRRLERELQEKIAAERARRTPEIIERLRREFSAISTPPPAATTASPTATPAAPVAVPSPHP